MVVLAYLMLYAQLVVVTKPEFHAREHGDIVDHLPVALQHSKVCFLQLQEFVLEAQRHGLE